MTATKSLDGLRIEGPQHGATNNEQMSVLISEITSISEYYNQWESDPQKFIRLYCGVQPYYLADTYENVYELWTGVAPTQPEAVSPASDAAPAELNVEGNLIEGQSYVGNDIYACRFAMRVDKVESIMEYNSTFATTNLNHGLYSVQVADNYDHVYELITGNPPSQTAIK